MSNENHYFSRITKKENGVYKVSISDSDIKECNPKGLVVPRFHPYKKHMVEALLEECINELNKLENYFNDDLFHLTKGLIATLGFMTDSSKCVSWKDHAYQENDKQSMIIRLSKAFDFNAELRKLKNCPFRQRLLPAVISSYGKDEEEPEIHVLEESNKSFHGVILFKETEDQRDRLASTIRLLAQISTSLKPDKSFNGEYDYFNGQTDHEIHEEWMFLLRGVCNALSYLVNCLSWKENNLHHFDLMELERKSGYYYYKG